MRGPLSSAERADRGQAIGRQNRSSRIGGRVDHDRPSSRADPILDRFGPVLEAVLFGDAHVDRLPLGVADEVRIARVVGIAQDHLVAGIQEVTEQEQHGGRGARRDENLVWRDRHAVRPRVVLRDRFAKRQNTEAMRVAGPPVLDRASQGIADGRRSLEVGLTELEVDHVEAGALELLGALGDFDGEKRLDLLDPPRERHGCRLPTLRRACRICQNMPGP